MAERARAEEALDSAHRKLGTDREHQRRRLAAELHDSVGQELIGLKLALEHIRTTQKDAQRAEVARALAAAVEKCQALIREVRGICYGLYPRALESFGLVPALKQLTAECQTPARVTFASPDALESARFPGDVEITLFRIAQEALSNALRHSQAGHIAIQLAYDGAGVVLTVTDDGVGFDPQKAAGRGLGLLSMKDRARTAHGTLSLSSRPGETRLEVRLPAEPRDASAP